MVEFIDKLRRKILHDGYRKKAKRVVKLIKDKDIEKAYGMLLKEPILPYVNELLPDDEKIYDVLTLHLMDLYEVSKDKEHAELQGVFKKCVIVKMDGTKTRIFRRITKSPNQYFSSVKQFIKECSGKEEAKELVCSNVHEHKRLSLNFIERFMTAKQLYAYEKRVNAELKKNLGKIKEETVFLK